MSIEKEEFIAYLGMIQGVINRMANCAFLIKGWSISLTAAIIALAATLKNDTIFFVAIIPILLFWWLDSFFFWQEKNYRNIYASVVEKKKRYELKQEELYNLNPYLLPENKPEKFVYFRMKMMFLENAVWPVYALQVVIIFIIGFILNWTKIKNIFNNTFY